MNGEAVNPNDPRKNLSPKAAGAAQGGGVGASLGIVIVWIMEQQGVEMDAAVAGAVAAIITALVGYVGAYLRRDWLRDKGAEKVMAEQSDPAPAPAVDDPYAEPDAEALGVDRVEHPTGAHRTPTSPARGSTALPPAGAPVGPPDKES